MLPVVVLGAVVIGLLVFRALAEVYLSWPGRQP